MGSGVEGLGFRVQGLGSRVEGFGLRPSLSFSKNEGLQVGLGCTASCIQLQVSLLFSQHILKPELEWILPPLSNSMIVYGGLHMTPINGSYRVGQYI